MGDPVYTAFGTYLAKHSVSYVEASAALGITRSYASMLANGRATPGLELAGEIEDWSHGEVTMKSWYLWIKAAKAAAEDARLRGGV